MSGSEKVDEACFDERRDAAIPSDRDKTDQFVRRDVTPQSSCRWRQPWYPDRVNRSQ